MYSKIIHRLERDRLLTNLDKAEEVDALPEIAIYLPKLINIVERNIQ